MGDAGMPWDMTNAVLSGFDWTAEEEATLDAQFPPYVADYSGIDDWTAYCSPTGRLDVSVVASFASHDPLATIVNVSSYLRAVDEAGVSEMYSAWVFDRFRPRHDQAARDHQRLPRPGRLGPDEQPVDLAHSS